MGRGLWVLAWAVGLILLLTALGRNPPAKFVPPAGTYEVMAVPEMWEVEYRAAAVCSGYVPSDPSRVRWYLVPSHYDGFVVPDRMEADDSSGRHDIGHWTPPHNIYISTKWMNFEWVIRHEALHDLTGTASHKRLLPLFEKCKAMWGYLE